jgi:hypothetical protein
LFTCQPTPLLRTEGGIGVALAYLDTAMKAPVDCGTSKFYGSVIYTSSKSFKN